MQRKFAWYSVVGEKEFSVTLPTTPVCLYERVGDGALVPATLLTDTEEQGAATVSASPEGRWFFQGEVWAEPLHRYMPCPHPLPAGGKELPDAEVHLLMQQRGWLGVDFALDALDREDQRLPGAPDTLPDFWWKAKVLQKRHGKPITEKLLLGREYARWTRWLLLVTPAYLDLLARTFRSKTPWAPLLGAAQHLVRDVPGPLATAHLPRVRCMDMGRRNVQQAAYLWCIERGREPPQGLGGPPPDLQGRLRQIHQTLFSRSCSKAPSTASQ